MVDDQVEALLQTSLRSLWRRAGIRLVVVIGFVERGGDARRKTTTSMQNTRQDKEELRRDCKGRCFYCLFVIIRKGLFSCITYIKRYILQKYTWRLCACQAEEA